MRERRTIRLDYQEGPRAEKPVTMAMALGVVLFCCGVAVCLALLLFVFRAG